MAACQTVELGFVNLFDFPTAVIFVPPRDEQAAAFDQWLQQAAGGRAVGKEAKDAPYIVARLSPRGAMIDQTSVHWQTASIGDHFQVRRLLDFQGETDQDGEGREARRDLTGPEDASPQLGEELLEDLVASYDQLLPLGKHRGMLQNDSMTSLRLEDPQTFHQVPPTPQLLPPSFTVFHRLPLCPTVF